MTPELLHALYGDLPVKVSGDPDRGGWHAFAVCDEAGEITRVVVTNEQTRDPQTRRVVGVRAPQPRRAGENVVPVPLVPLKGKRVNPVTGELAEKEARG